MKPQSVLATLSWLVLMLAAAAPAQASIVYRLVGGLCTDGTRKMTRQSLPEAPYESKDVAGDLYCASQIFSEISLSDSYVPGTSVTDSPWSRGVIDSVVFDDGLVRYASLLHGDERVHAQMPVTSGPGWLFIQFNCCSSDAMKVELDGTWGAWREYGPGGCEPGSIPGLAGTCSYTPHYYATGSYVEWQRIPEPATLALMGAALAVVAVRRRRKPTWRAAR